MVENIRRLLSITLIWTVTLVLTVSEASIQGISQPAGGDALLGIRYARASRFMPADPEPFPTNLDGRTEHGASCWQVWWWWWWRELLLNVFLTA